MGELQYAHEVCTPCRCVSPKGDDLLGGDYIFPYLTSGLIAGRVEINWSWAFLMNKEII